MNFPWDNVFDFFQDRNRGALFFRSLGAFLVMFLLGALADEVVVAGGWQDQVVYVIPVVGSVVSLWLCVLIRRGRAARRRQRYKSTPLSRDELGKARSKLMGRQTQGMVWTGGRR